MNTLAFIPGVPGYLEFLVVVFFGLLLFGPKRLPQLMRSVGKSINEFKRGQAEGLPEDTEKNEEDKLVEKNDSEK